MANEDLQDSVHLCDAILEDGEVSVEEARGLADWLQEHPETAEEWPASELAQPLREIWADGVVQRRELQRLARLLVSLQRARAAGRAEASPEAALPAAAGRPHLPSVAVNLPVPSWSEPGVVHRVDLRGPSCTCHDWQERRAHLPPGHLSRCCKHILAAYAQLPRRTAEPGWLEAFIDYGWPTHPRTVWELLTVEHEDVLISSAGPKGWANVFALEDGIYKRFSYQMEEHRWAYQAEPRRAWVIIDAIRSLSLPSSRSLTSDHSPARATRRSGRRFRRTHFLLAASLLVVALALWSQRGQSKAPRALTARHAQEWTAKTLRAVQAESGGRKIFIPAGVSLRVIARGANDVMVSYEGRSVIISRDALAQP